jgi:transposase
VIRTDYSGQVQMKRAYKFRAYPTRSQEGRAARLLADHCDLYNAALEEGREAWRRHGVSISYGRQSGQLRAIRAADPDGQGRHSFTAQQQTLRRLDAVFRAFYARTQSGGAGYPRFKPYCRFHQVLFVAGDGARCEPANPRFLANAQGVIADLQRRQERAQRGSGNRKRIRRQLAREWRKVRRRRSGFHHKTARTLVSSFDVIALEQLNTQTMTHRPAPRLDGAGVWLPNGAAAKAGLNKVILDAGWAQFMTILVGKAEEAGRRVVFVNPARTSTDCYQCGARCQRPRQNLVVCPQHGGMDADINAARNIATRAGLGSGHACVA